MKFKVGDKVKALCSFKSLSGNSTLILPGNTLTIKSIDNLHHYLFFEEIGKTHGFSSAYFEPLPQPQATYDPNNYVGIYCPPGFELGTDYWSEKPACNHSWKRYEGIMNVYDFCVHCDEKRGV